MSMWLILSLNNYLANKIFSLLTDRKNTDKEYEYVIKVWLKFEMKTMKDYHNLYLNCKFLLLADVFEKFRIPKKLGIMSTSLFEYTRFDAMLKMTKIKLKLISDPEMIQMQMDRS